MNIYQKISAVMQDVEYLAKDNYVKYESKKDGSVTTYKAMSEEKVTMVVRNSLIRHGIVIIPVNQEHKREGTLTTVNTTYRIQNVEDTEDYILAVSSGTGADTQDKGVGKAMTYAFKYLLLRTFAIPTGEDSDKISSAELDEKMERERKRKITDREIMVLSGLVQSSNTDEAALLGNYKVSRYNDMTKEQYDDAIQILNKKLNSKSREAIA